MKKSLKYMLPALLLAACNTTPKDDGTLPASDFPPFNRVELNLSDGYKTDFLYGDSIRPVINSLGDTVVTGVPVRITGKRINPDSLARPKTIKAGINRTSKNVYSHIHPVPGNVKTVSINPSNFKKVEIPEVLPGDTSHYFVNRIGDTIRTGVPVSLSGKVSPAMQPKPVTALLPKMKDNAIYDLQFLDRDVGMSENRVLSLLNDRNGHLWLGTNWGGFSRYDGTYFHHYKGKDGDADDTRVYAIIEDKWGNLWQARENGIRKFDGQTYTDFTDISGLSNSMVSTVMEDSRGNIWVATISSGLALLQPDEYGQSYTVTFFTQKEGLSGNTVLSLMEDKNGRLWIGTIGGGLNLFDPYEKGQAGNQLAANRSFIHLSVEHGLPDNRINSLLEDKDGTIWIGSDNGLFRYLPSDDNTTATLIHYTIESGLTDNRVWTMLEDSDGNIWIGTDGGLNRHVEVGNGQDYFVHITMSEGLPSDLITAIIQGEDGILWIGTFGGGVIRLNNKSFNEFLQARRETGSEMPVMLEDSKGNYWFNAVNGVMRYTPSNNGAPGVYSAYTTKEGLVDDQAITIFEDSKGIIWIGTVGGVSRFDPEAGAFTNFIRSEGLSGNEVWKIIEDKNGNYWFATLGGGVTLYEPAKDKGRFTHFTEEQGLPNSFVFTMLLDGKGTFWFGTMGGGLCRFEPDSDGNSGTLTIYSEKEGLSHNIVLSSLEDKEGIYWFGTWGGGINRFDGSTFTHFTEREGLSHNRVPSLIEDQNGTIWASTLNRVSYITRGQTNQAGSGDSVEPNYILAAFQKNDGLKDIEVFTYQPWLDSKGRILWGHDNGYVLLDLNEFQLNQNQPKVHLRQIEINNEFLVFRNLPEKNNTGIQFDRVQPFENIPLNLSLSYDHNHLTFYYSAIEWRSPHQLRYSHRLLGLDGNWSVPSADAKTDYRNLPHGKFIFQVRAIGQSQQWSEPFEYAFTIRPPWWFSWWAYIIYGILFGVIIYRVHLYQKSRAIRQERLKAQAKELEQKREIEKAYNHLKETQAQLIHAEKMASLGELTAGIAHEIQNPLNFVNNFSEVSKELIGEMNDELAVGNIQLAKEISTDIEQNLEKIHHHGKRADAIVKGMLQHSRSNSGQKEPTDINALADEYLRLSYHGLRAKDKSRSDGQAGFNADFKTDFDPDLPLVKVVPQDIGRVLLNLINNAFYAVTLRRNAIVKTTHALSQTSPPYKPTVTVTTKYLGNRVEIAVKDNGPGIPDTIKDKIFQPFFTTKPTGQGTGLGLSLSYDIVKAHGGDLKVETREGAGSEFFIQLPVNNNNH
jgi:signal transduction histidine kinase/ligand-binding sensor domain-containing protein